MNEQPNTKYKLLKDFVDFYRKDSCLDKLPECKGLTNAFSYICGWKLMREIDQKKPKKFAKRRKGGACNAFHTSKVVKVIINDVNTGANLIFCFVIKVLTLPQ